MLGEKLMTLEAVVFPQDLFGCNSSKEFYISSGGGWSFHEFGGLGVDEEEKGQVIENTMNGEGGDCMTFKLSCSSSMLQTQNECNVNSLPSLETGEVFGAREAKAPVEKAPRRKRRRTKCYKNKEEVESQRMAHIAVERNRRKQMNEYLGLLRSLMPASYAQRGDQASIVGGAINFVKELEQLLQTLEAQKNTKDQSTATSPFASFFTFPQYSSSFSAINNHNNSSTEVAADIEVTMIESHVNLKVRVKRQRKQLLRMVMGLQSLSLTTLHLNVTTAAYQTVLYSFSLKVEDDCQFTSVDEIAAAVYQMVGRIQCENVVPS